MGVYDAEATANLNENLSDISTLKDPRSKDASQRCAFIFISYQLRKYEQTLSNRQRQSSNTKAYIFPSSTTSQN